MLHRRTLTALLTICLLLSALCSANSSSSRIFNSIVLAKSDGMTLQQATARVRQQTGGRILSAKESRRDGRKIYRIKVLLPSGNVRVVTVYADGS